MARAQTRTSRAVRERAGVPPTPRTWVPRPDLAARLDEALRSPLTLVVSPAGTGKTSGLAAWCHAHPEVPVSWVPAGAALERERLADLLDSDDGLVVVDDAHLLSTPVVRLLEEWLDAGAPGPRVALLCRWDPPISRLVPMLRGQLVTLRGDALRLPDAKARALVAAHAPGLAPEQVDLITEVAHGWAAVLALAARTVSGAQDPESAARRLAETGTGVTDLIASQVFATLGDRTRHLLLCLADEGLVEPATAERLTGDPLAGELLGELADSGLLVTRRDAGEEDDGSVFTVHPLLAEVARRRIRAGGVAVAQARATVRKAARADVAAGRVAVGLQRLVAAQAWEDAVEVLDTQGERLLMQVPSNLLGRVVEAAPDRVAASPGACVTLALDRWVHADFASASDWIRRLQALPDESPHRVDRALVKLLGARLGGEPPGEAVEAARAVVDASDFRAGSPVLTAWLLVELGVAETWIGDLGAAESHLRWAVAVAEPISRRLHAGALSHLAQTTYLLGDHANAAALAERAAERVLATGLGTGGPVAGVLSRARIVQALATSSVGETTAGHQDQIGSGDTVTALSDPMTTVLRQLWTARTFLETGELEEAASWLEMSRGVPPMPAHVQVLVLVERAAVAATAGDPRALDEVRARLVAQGAATEAALVDAARVSASGDPRAAAAGLAAAARGDLPHVLRESPLVALVYGAQLSHPGGPRDLDWSVDGTPARVLLSRAGGAARWVRLLVDLGAPRGADRPGGHEAGAPVVPPTSSDLPAHVPHLTARESEVLAHLGRGSTYADIAESLVVSENTVKTHVSAVYAKLGAGRRSEALKIARSLGLV